MAETSFHSRLENVNPYETSDYAEVYGDCEVVQREILRFASAEALADTTTVHYCLATKAGVQALKDNGVKGLLGLYGTAEAPRRSYQTSEAGMERIRRGETVTEDGVAYRGIDLILNSIGQRELIPRLEPLMGREQINVMIHEQYFYADYPRYQPDFEEKLNEVFAYFKQHDYCSAFFSEWLGTD